MCSSATSASSISWLSLPLLSLPLRTGGGEVDSVFKGYISRIEIISVIVA